MGSPPIPGSWVFEEGSSKHYASREHNGWDSSSNENREGSARYNLKPRKIGPCSFEGGIVGVLNLNFGTRSKFVGRGRKTYVSMP